MPIDPTQIQTVSDAVGGLGHLASIGYEASKAFSANVSRNLGQAVSQLGAALLDIPTAKLQNRSAAIRSTTDSQTALTAEASRRIAAQLNVSDEVLLAAQEEFFARALGKQVNLKKVVRASLKELASSDSSANEDAGEISHDWLNIFADEASKMSSENMQSLFGKVLAGEISRPGSFSVKSLRTLSEMSQATAEKFVALCSFITIVEVAPNEDVGAVPWHALSKFIGQRRTEFKAMTLELEAEGLMYPGERDVYFSRHLCTETTEQDAATPLRLDGKSYRIKDMTVAANSPKEVFNLSCMTLTRTGRELFEIVSVPTDREYLEGFCQALENAGLVLEEI